MEAVIELEDGNVFDQVDLLVNPEPVEGDDRLESEEFMSILDISHLDKLFMR